MVAAARRVETAVLNNLVVYRVVAVSLPILLQLGHLMFNLWVIFLQVRYVTASQPLIVNVNTAPGAYPLKISFVYINDQNHTFVDDQVITLLVYRLPILEISFYQDVSTLFVAQPNTLPIQVVNLGRNSIVLGMMRVEAPSGQLSNNSILVGTLDPGGYFTLDAIFIPDIPGTTDLIVSIDYTDDFQPTTGDHRYLTVDVMDQPIIEPPVDGNQNGGSDVILTSSRNIPSQGLALRSGLDRP